MAFVPKGLVVWANLLDLRLKRDRGECQGRTDYQGRDKEERDNWVVEGGRMDVLEDGFEFVWFVKFNGFEEETEEEWSRELGGLGEES